MNAISMKTNIKFEHKTILQDLLMNKITQADFTMIDHLIIKLHEDLKSERVSQREINEMIESMGPLFLSNTVQGRAFKKEFGYAGDFMTIDNIYTFSMSPIKAFRIWDEFFHRSTAAKAVRNRKTYFKQLMADKVKSIDSLKLLNVASGPARDLFEFYESGIDCNVNTTCVEMDQHAIDYASELNQNHLDKIEFVQQNIFKFRTDKKFDLIWSAGLFDYFEDKYFVRILRRLKENLNPSGEIVIGNFNEAYNPSRAYMETLGDWHLHHRTDAELIELGKAAGFESNQICVGREPENVNLFLHLRQV